MPSSDSFPSQIDFRFLSVPDVQQVTQEHDAVDHDAFCRTGSSASIETAAFDAIDQNTFSRGGSTCLAISASLDRDIHVPVNHISPDVHALLAAAEASAARRADGMQSEMGMAADLVSTQQNDLEGIRDPLRILSNTAAPKRYFRTFWRSISIRLHRRARVIY
jgi:hypothetical protein